MILTIRCIHKNYIQRNKTKTTYHPTITVKLNHLTV